MATVTSLDFAINSKWDGSGIREAKAQIDELDASLRKISGESARITIQVDTADATAKIDRIRRDIDELSNKSARIKVDLDDSAARAKINEIKRDMDSISGKSVAIKADDSDAVRKINEIKRDIDSISGKNVAIRADDSDAMLKVEQIKGAIDSLSNKSVRLDVDTDAARAKLDTIRAKVDEFGSKRAVAVADINTTGTAKLDELKLKLDEFGLKHVTARADVDTNRASTDLQALGRVALSAGEDLGRVATDAGQAAGGIGQVGSSAASAGGPMGSFGTGIAVVLAGMAAFQAAAPLVAASAALLPLAFMGAALLLINTNKELKKSFDAAFNDALKPLLEAAMPLINSLLQGFKYLADQVRLIEPLIRGAFASAAPLVRPFIDLIVDFVKGALPGFTDGMRNMKPLIEGLAQGAGLLGKAFGQVVDIFAHINGLGPIMTQILGAVGGLLVVLAQAIAQVVSADHGRLLVSLLQLTAQFLQALTPILVQTAPLFIGVSNAILFVVQHLTDFRNISSPMIAVMGLMGNATRDLGGWFNKLGGWAQGAAREIDTFVTQTSAKIANWVAQTSTQIAGWITRTAGQFANWVSQIVSQFTNWVSQTTSKITGWISQTAGQFTSWVTQTVGQFTNWVSQTTAKITGWVSSTVGQFTNWVSQTTAKITGWVSSTVSQFTNWVSQTTSKITGWVSSTVSQFTNWVSQTTAKITGWVSSTVSQFTNWVSQTTSKISSWVTQTVGQFTSWVSQTTAKFTGWVSQIISDFTNWVSQMISHLTSFVGQFTSGWGKLWNDVMSLATRIWGDIQSGFQRFASGVESTLQGLVSKAQSIWNSIVGIFKTPVNAVIDVWDHVAGAVGLPTISKLADGGHVQGAGTATSDSIPAMLSHGEYVVNARAVDHYGLGTMEAMNARRLASGGPVYLAGGGTPANPGGGGTPSTGNGTNVLGSPASVTATKAAGQTASVDNGLLGKLANVVATAVYDIAKPILDGIINKIPHPIPGVTSPAGMVPYTAAKKIEDGVLGKLKAAQDAAKAAAAAAASGNVDLSNLPKAPANMVHASPAQAVAYAKNIVGAGQIQALYQLWTGESGWRWNATNGSSGAYGIPQSLPASKMAAAGSDWHDNAGTQINWGIGYIRSVYGTPANALSKWQSRSPHWYEHGTGYAMGGMAIVGEAGPEMINMRGGEGVEPFQRLLEAARGEARGGGEVTINMPITANGGNSREVVAQIEAEVIPKLRRLMEQGVGWRNR